MKHLSSLCNGSPMHESARTVVKLG